MRADAYIACEAADAIVSNTYLDDASLSLLMYTYRGKLPGFFAATTWSALACLRPTLHQSMINIRCLKRSTRHEHVPGGCAVGFRFRHLNARCLLLDERKTKQHIIGSLTGFRGPLRRVRPRTMMEGERTFIRIGIERLCCHDAVYTVQYGLGFSQPCKPTELILQNHWTALLEADAAKGALGVCVTDGHRNACNGLMCNS